MRHISEDRMRGKHAHKEMIDPSTLPSVAGRRPQLEQAGWYLRDHAKEQAKVKIEIPVDGYDAEAWNGVTDYCLYRENGKVLAVEKE